MYEIEIIEEYIESLKQAINQIENKQNVIVDITFTTDQTLEKINESQATMDKIEDRFFQMMRNFDHDVVWRIARELTTIADYRREFNDRYCEKVDVLMWGETDALIPKQTFEILDNLHSSVKNTTPKYLGFFSTCKMWDDSWKPLEHPDFTNKPFVANDYDNWWSLKYTMSAREMYKINEETTELDVKIVSPHKFNGCGLVISSEVIKAGVNIPKSVFFVHEDSAFMWMTNKVLGNIPQYLIKNILLVHNRNHPKKRLYIKGERADGTMNEKRRSNEWYVKANKMCEQNYLNLFNPNYTSFTWKDALK